MSGFQCFPRAGGSSNSWEAKGWQQLLQAFDKLPDRSNFSGCAAEPFVDAGDLTLVNAVISGGYCSNTKTAAYYPTLTVTSGMVIADTGIQSGYPTSNLVDGVDTTYADFLGASPSLYVNLGTAQSVARVGIINYASGVSYAATGISVYGSTDNSTWVLQGSVSGLSASTSEQFVTFTQASYRYWKIMLTGPSHTQACTINLRGYTPVTPNAATITLNPVTISGATAGKIILNAYNADATAALDIGNSSNKVEVYPMITGTQGAALSFPTVTDEGSNIYQFVSEEFSLSGATTFGARIQSFARSVAPNLRIHSALLIWR